MVENGATVVQMKNISKRFPGVQALHNVSLTIEAGKVHALVGENGAGKSTLMKILSGVYQSDEGELLFLGEPVVFHNAREALDKGISTIYQELMLCPNLSVAENIFLGREPVKGPFLDYDVYRQCQEELNQIGFTDLKPRKKISDLTVAQQQMVEIAKALSLDSHVIIMDEPTSSLTPSEVDHLFRTIGQLKERGKAIIFISHRLEEVFEIADQVTILRDGEQVTSRPIADITHNEMVRLMVNRELEISRSVRYEGHLGKVLLEVRNLSKAGQFENVSFKLHQAEVLGFAGLIGAGRTELMRAIFGIDPIDSGQIYVEGQEVKIRSPQHAIHLGLGMATEDRKHDGLFGALSVRENMTMADLYSNELTDKLGFVRRKREVEIAKMYVGTMDIRTPGLTTQIISLSGGNQQKVILSRWLMTQPKVLILDEPTRGIDVGAKAEIHKLIRQLANEGHGIIVVSSELPELLAVSDNLIVMREGHITGRFETAATDQEEIMTSATIGEPSSV